MEACECIDGGSSLKRLINQAVFVEIGLEQLIGLSVLEDAVDYIVRAALPDYCSRLEGSS